MKLTLIHCYLCHHHLAGIRKLLLGNLVTGLKLDSKAEPDLVCEACKAGKMQADCYWVSFIDDFSRFKAVYLLKCKSETFGTFKQFKAWAENLTGERMGSLHDDK